MPAARKPKGQYHHGDLRRALLDAALDLLRRGEDVGLREVARRAGVSQTAPYRHFADKDALLAEVAEEGFDALTAALRKAYKKAGNDPLERYLEAATAYVVFAVHHPAHYRVMFGASSAVTKIEVPEGLAAAGEEAFGILLTMIEEMQKADLIRKDPPLEIALALWSLEHGLAMLELDGHTAMLPLQSTADRARLVHRLLLEGLAPKNDSASDKGDKRRSPLRR
jgi:AcrR family transcriptional regulator